MLLHGEEVDVTTVPELVRSRARLGDRELLRIRDETLTYADADTRPERLAQGLAGLGISKGNRVATFAYNSIDHVCFWFACAKLGAIWVPLNVSLGPEDLRYSLRDADVSLVLVDEELLERYLQVRRPAGDRPLELLWGDARRARRASMMSFDDLSADHNGAGFSAEVLPSDPMAIVYTGGSTGMPKGVLVPHLYYIAAAMRFRDVAVAVESDVMYESGHLFHSGGQQLGVTGPMFCGMTSVMTRWFSVSRFWDVIKANDTTVIHVPGTMLGPIIERTPVGPADREHRVRVGVGTGTGQIRSEIRDEFEQRFAIPLLEVWAQTELGVLLCSQRIDDRPAGSSGHSDGWAELRIADDLDRPVPVGEVGQILVRPTEPFTTMLEYVGKQEQTLRAWRNLWYHTGDEGRVDGEGRLYFAGRKAFWLRRRGENVSAHEVEAAVSSHPDVVDCAVVGVPGEIGDEDIKAYVQMRPNRPLDPAGLIEWCRARIAYFKCPRYIEFVDDFPRTVIKGDIERQKLRDLGIGSAWDHERGEWLLAADARA